MRRLERMRRPSSLAILLGLFALGCDALGGGGSLPEPELGSRRVLAIAEPGGDVPPGWHPGQANPA